MSETEVAVLEEAIIATATEVEIKRRAMESARDRRDKLLAEWVDNPTSRGMTGKDLAERLGKHPSWLYNVNRRTADGG